LQAPLQLRELEIDVGLIPKSIGLLKHVERIVIYGEASFPEDICNLWREMLLPLTHFSLTKEQGVFHSVFTCPHFPFFVHLQIAQGIEVALVYNSLGVLFHKRNKAT
jgi:hypothetical protein